MGAYIYIYVHTYASLEMQYIPNYVHSSLRERDFHLCKCFFFFNSHIHRFLFIPALLPMGWKLLSLPASISADLLSNIKLY